MVPVPKDIVGCGCVGEGGTIELSPNLDVTVRPAFILFPY